MKKSIHSVLAAVLAIALTFLCVPPTFALPNLGLSPVWIYDDGETSIQMYTNVSGELVFEQYVFHTLVRRDTLSESKPGYIVVEDYSGVARGPQTYMVTLTPYVTSQTTDSESEIQFTHKGYIRFNRADTTIRTYDVARCDYCKMVEINTVYTINSYVGDLVDLAANLAGILPLPQGKLVQVLAGLLIGYGIDVVGGKIENAISPTVACIQREYYWKFTDYYSEANVATGYGTSYYVTDSRPEYAGQIISEGRALEDWGTQEFAEYVHGKLFNTEFLGANY